MSDEKNRYDYTRWPWFEALVLEKSMIGGIIHEDGALEWFEEDLIKTKNNESWKLHGCCCCHQRSIIDLDKERIS